jgi:flagellar hook protein FlgE
VKTDYKKGKNMSIVTAQSGIKAAQVAMGVSVENVVSAQNVGGKSASVDFSAVVTSSSSSSYSPGAVRTLVSRNVTEQGILKSTGIATHIAITGADGFVLTKNSLVPGDGQFGLKRGGAFSRNQQGYLEDKGVFLMGWPLGANGDIKAGVNKETLEDLIPIQVNQIAGVVRATTEIEFSGNLSSGNATPLGNSFTKTQRIYDSMGTPHDLIFTFTRLAAGADADNQVQYSAEITVNGGTVKRGDAAGAQIDGVGAPMIVTFNQLGQFNLCDYGQPTESNIAPKLHIDWTDPNFNGASMDIDLKLGKGKGATPTNAAIVADPTAEGGLTAYDGNSLMTYSQQDGLDYGRFENIRIEEDGTVTALFSNGRNVAIARVAMGTVASPNDLEFVTGNIFYETRKSGSILLGQAGENGFGKIESGALESSTVSLDEEFGKIMELKIYHQGCLMSMKQSDRMAEELMQIMK